MKLTPNEYQRAYDALVAKIRGISGLLAHAEEIKEARAIRELRKRRNRAEAQKRRVAQKLNHI